MTVGRLLSVKTKKYFIIFVICKMLNSCGMAIINAICSKSTVTCYLKTPVEKKV